MEMSWDNNPGKKVAIEHTDTLKRNRANGRMLQVVGAIVSLLGFLSCFFAPFTTATVKDSFGLMVFGILMAVVGKGVEWVYKE